MCGIDGISKGRVYIVFNRAITAKARHLVINRCLRLFEDIYKTPILRSSSGCVVATVIYPPPLPLPAFPAPQSKSKEKTSPCHIYRISRKLPSMTDIQKLLKESKAEYRQLGKSGLRVSVPILGAMSIGSKQW